MRPGWLTGLAQFLPEGAGGGLAGTRVHKDTLVAVLRNRGGVREETRQRREMPGLRLTVDSFPGPRAVHVRRAGSKASLKTALGRVQPVERIEELEAGLS